MAASPSFTVWPCKHKNENYLQINSEGNSDAVVQALKQSQSKQDNNKFTQDITEN